MLKFGLDEAGYTSQTGTPRTTLTPGASEEHQKNNTCTFTFQLKKPRPCQTGDFS